MTHPAQSLVSRRQVCHILFRQKRKIALVFVGVMGLACALTLFMPRTYRSQAKLLVRLGRENAALDPTASFGQAPVVALPPSRENDINSALEILKSRYLLEKVVDAVGPEIILGRRAAGTSASPTEADEDTRQAAVNRLSRKLEVEAVKKSNIVALTYDGPSPDAAQVVVSRLIECYLERYAHLHRSPGARRFLAEQAERMHAQLTRTEDELRRRKDETGLVAPEEQRKSLVARLAVLDDDYLKTMAARIAAEAELKALRERLKSIAPTHVLALTQGLPDQVSAQLRGQLFNLRQKELEMAARHGPDHADVRLAHKQTAAAQAALDREIHEREQVTTGPNRTYEEGQIALLKEEALLASLKARTDELARQRDYERAALKTLNRDELAITRLQRDVELQTLQYRKYVESREQAEIDVSLESERISNISIVQPATRDADPVRPRPLLYLALAFVIALVGSFGLAVLSENLDRSLKTEEEVERVLGLSVLAALPYQRGQPANGEIRE